MDIKPDDSLGGWLLLIFASALGRLIYHGRQVMKRQRKLISWVLLLEMGTAVGMGFVTKTVTLYYGLPVDAALGVAFALAYLGPHLFDVALARWSGDRARGGD